MKERIFWKNHEKVKEIEFNIDENWLDKSLPVDNHLADCDKYFDSLDDIDQDTLLSIPIKIVRF